MSKLEAVSITKSFGDNTILQDVSLRLEPREIVCLLGVSGGGKTTLFNVLSGLTLPDRGQVFLDGREITGKAGHISYMLQKDLLMPYRTVLDNIALPLIIKGAPKKEARRKALEHFAEFGLSGTEKQYPAQLSGGLRQRAALLRTSLCSEGAALLVEPWTLSPKPLFTAGIWRSWSRSSYPPCLLPMISTRQSFCLTGFTFFPESPDISRRS